MGPMLVGAAVKLCMAFLPLTIRHIKHQFKAVNYFFGSELAGGLGISAFRCGVIIVTKGELAIV